MDTEVLLTLGQYRFSISTAAYTELVRTCAYAWAEQARIGHAPALQFVGFEAETITLRGVIYPHFRGGLHQVDQMREAAAAGGPLNLTTGVGDYLGRWVIERITEKGTMHLSNGSPRSIEFDLAIKKYDNGKAVGTMTLNYTGNTAGGTA